MLCQEPGLHRGDAKEHRHWVALHQVDDETGTFVDRDDSSAGTESATRAHPETVHVV